MWPAVEADPEMSSSLRCLDVLVHSAGILINGSLETLSLAEYDRIMNINTRAAFLLTQLCAPHLAATRGAVVHVSSVTGLRAFPGVLGYCVSKAALDQLVRCAALDLASKGCRTFRHSIYNFYFFYKKDSSTLDNLDNIG